MGRRRIRFSSEGESNMPKSRSEKPSGQAQARNEQGRKKSKAQAPQGAMNGGSSQKGCTTSK